MQIWWFVGITVPEDCSYLRPKILLTVQTKKNPEESKEGEQLKQLLK